MLVSPHGKQGGAPDPDSGEIIEAGVELQRGAAPQTRREWKTEGYASLDIWVRVEDLFVRFVETADDEACTPEISFEGCPENIRLSCVLSAMPPCVLSSHAIASSAKVFW